MFEATYQIGFSTFANFEQCLKHPFKGKTQSIESKQKMKDMWKNRIELKCPHCGKVGKNNMNRYHFDNCKDKIGNIK